MSKPHRFVFEREAGSWLCLLEVEGGQKVDGFRIEIRINVS